jgi:hypothetical protein
MSEPIPAAERDPERERVITVRLPASLHQQLKLLAGIRGVSLNALCVELLADYASRESTRRDAELKNRLAVQRAKNAAKAGKHS